MSIHMDLSRVPESLTEQSVRFSEPDWLRERRLAASQLAEQLPMPSPEKTKLTRWPQVWQHGLVAVRDVELHELDEEWTRMIGEAKGAAICVSDGRRYLHLDAAWQEQGIVLCDLQQAMESHPDYVQSVFGKIVRADEHRLSALHEAYMDHILFLFVPKGVVVKDPLQFVFVMTDERPGLAPHVVVVAEEDSLVSVSEHYLNTSQAAGALHNGVVEIVARQHARVMYATIQDYDANVTTYAYRRAWLENEAKIDWIAGEMNGGDTIVETASILQGDGSQSDNKVIAVGTGKQRVNYTTRAVHVGRHTDSQMTTRAVMRDESSGIFNGITKMEKGASCANGEQAERVLMLSPDARGDANPILLIDEDDVTAGHAASVGQVDESQLFYMMSRGIDKATALRLLIYGFLAPVISELPTEQIQSRLQSLVERKLAQ